MMLTILAVALCAFVLFIAVNWNDNSFSFRRSKKQQDAIDQILRELDDDSK